MPFRKTTIKITAEELRANDRRRLTNMGKEELDKYEIDPKLMIYAPLRQILETRLSTPTYYDNIYNYEEYDEENPEKIVNNKSPNNKNRKSRKSRRNRKSRKSRY